MAPQPISDDDLFEAKQAVRSFSWKTYSEDPKNDLAESLAVADETTKADQTNEAMLQEQWKELFDPATRKAFNGSQEEKILASSTDELAQAYKAFLKCLPKGHEAWIEDGPPRLNVVVEAVKVADTKWRDNREKTKAGRMKTLFGKVAGSLNKHRDLFAVLPSGDKYVCLLTGSVSAIVKATVNHDKIAEAVSNALDNLSDDVDYWKETLELHRQNVRMKEYVAKLYVVVFQFLVAIMTKWSKSSISRLLRSFDSEFFKDEIEEKKTKIRDLERRLDRQASLAVQRSIKEAPTQDQIANIIATAQAKFDANFWQKAERYQRGLGEAMVKTLQEQYLSALWTQREELDRHRNSPLPQMISRQPSSTPEASKDTRIALEQIQLEASRFVDQYTPQSHVAILIEQAQDLNVNIEIFDRIKRWNASPVSQILWIQGPFQVSIPSRYTLLSAYVVATAQRAGIPLVYYFCDPSTDAIDLIYYIIGQLMQTAAGEVPSELAITPARFGHLDGTAESLRDAISLIRDLLTLAPYILFAVIDGLQMIDTASNRAILAELINTLRFAGSQRSARSFQVFKVLITTDGFTEVLTSFKGDERLDALDLAGEDGARPEADGIEMSFF